MNIRVIFISILLSIFSGYLYGQKGTLAGKVVDQKSGEVLIGANLYIPQIESGTVTGVSGEYLIKLDPGTYKVQFSYVSYGKKIIEDVKIEPGSTKRLNIALEPENRQMEEVVVSANRLDNNEVSLLRLQKKSYALQDGISYEQMRKLGIDNTAESLKQVTGAAVEDGKYVVMRGLGGRYSISLMNGVNLPSTNPYRNSTSLDLVPSNMIDNVIVKKTFTPDLPGSFTGGAVDITTKSLPDDFYLSAKVTAGYNDQTTFKNDFVRDPVSGKFDALGFDDGSRALPEAASEVDNPVFNVQAGILEMRTGSNQGGVDNFDQSMKQFSGLPFHVKRKAPPLNSKFSFSTGNRYDFKANSLGFNLGLNYSRNFTHYDDREINNYTARESQGDNRMQAFLLNRGVESNEVNKIGGILSVAYRYKQSNEIKYTSIYNNIGDFSVINMTEGTYPGALSNAGNRNFKNRTMAFTQRNLWNNQLEGKHQLNILNESNLKWSANFIISGQYEPDVRFIGADVDQAGYGFDPAEYPLPFHFFRELEDRQFNLKVEMKTPVFDNFDLKYGLSASKKMRDFTERRFQLNTQYAGTDGYEVRSDEYLSFPEADGNYEAFFSRANTGIIGNTSEGSPIFGNAYNDQTQPSNLYSGDEQVAGGYLMGIFNFSENLKTVVGARAEKTDYAVESSSGNEKKGTIDNLDILPSLNMTYNLNGDANLRFAASRTLARPNMREMAPFISFDLLGGFPVIGNPDIDMTNITNIDLRYELFPDAGELFAVSTFFKDFQDPIVLQLDPKTGDQPNYEYINTQSGFLTGAEIEYKQSLDFIGQAFNKFKIATNFSYIYSRVDLSGEEFEIRQKVNPALKSWRPFSGQSPYLFNINLTYDDPDKGWEGAVYANVFGPRLFANGTGAAPDIYEVFNRRGKNGRMEDQTPLPDLNLKVKKQITKSLAASLSISNILDYSIIRYQEHNDVYYTNEVMNPGRTYSLSLKYSIKK